MALLSECLGGMRDIAQWFVWRLEWDGAENKYQKTPCALDGSVYRLDASLPSNWTRYESAARAVEDLNASPACADRRLQYALGFWMTADCGYWFFDIDKCANEGVLTQFASQMVAAFPGAMMEWSSSKRGIHIFGRTAAPVPPHRSRDIHKLHLEFYTQDRGVAFGLDGQAQGNADTVHDAMVQQLVTHYFPPRAAGEEGEFDKPRKDWRGPTDDDELIRRALQARVSAEAAFGGKASFAQLWRGEAEQCSESDMALASHLAFWTGCDAPRMERLMRRSGLARDKWDSHRTYLRELTIANACSGCSSVYQEPERQVSPAVMQMVYGPEQAAASSNAAMMPTTVISPELSARVNELLDMVSSCGNVDEMHAIVIPTIQQARIPLVYAERLVRAVNKQLDLWDSKLPIARLRHMLCPPVVQRADATDAPEWVHQHCYVKEGDFFFNVTNGARLSLQGFIAEHGRLMPLKDNGSRENAAEWALHRWGMATVHRVAYRPDEGSYFTWDGLDYVNSYNASTVPSAMAMSQVAIDGVEAFKSLLWDMCARRIDVYEQVLHWMAWCVQNPGRKLMWSPIFKGVQGDGKSIVGVMLRSVMGWRNVTVTGNSTLRNSGGFNDWAVGGAVNVIEEIMLRGKERHAIYNAMKEFITNDVVNINPKGKATYMCRNVTNHMATTNHADALPLERGDRRWMVIFTPWDSLAEMLSYSGLSEGAFQARFDAIDVAMKTVGGELRTWFLSITARPSRQSPWTPEKARMEVTSKDSAETIAAQIIEEGAHGVTAKVLSSSCLTHLLKTRALMDSIDMPKGMEVNHMLTRLGFSQFDRPIKWEGKTHRIWIKNGVNDDLDNLRAVLDTSRLQR